MNRNNTGIVGASRMTLVEHLRRLNACPEAVLWVEQHPNPETAWASCQRGDWMLWLLGKCAGKPWSDQRKLLVLASCACARLALPHTQDPRVLRCIKTAEAWARGEATQDQVRSAAYAAAEAAEAAYAEAAKAAAAAAYGAAYAAYAAAAAAADGAAYAAYTADAEGYAVYAARNKLLAQCADIVRSRIPAAEIMAALEVQT